MWAWILSVIEWLRTGTTTAQKTDVNAVPPASTVTPPVIAKKPETISGRAYMTPAVVKLLAIIRAAEGGKAGYNSDYANDDRWPLTTMSLDQVLAAARSQVQNGGRVGRREPSSAVGAYQFLTTTLSGLKAQCKLTGRETFNENLQDDLAYQLMVNRGLNSYMSGLLSATAFANNLAKEWASLPVVSAIQGAHRLLRPGQSYYAGDGLNKSLHSVEEIVRAVAALKG